MTVEVTSELVGKYERDGYLIFPDVLDADLMKEAQEHVQWLINKNPNLRPEQLHTNLINNDPFWLRLVRDDRLLDIAQSFIGPDIALFASHYICKPAFTGQPVLWHQDGSYWPLEPMKVISLWLAVDDSTTENGCLRVIPGTHQLQLQEMKGSFDVENVLSSEIEKKFVDESKAVDLVLKSGSVSIHHPNIIHGSKANLSPHRRCGLTIRYIPTSTKVKKENHPIFLMRGDKGDVSNTYLAFPKFDVFCHMSFQGCENFG
ncbi:phytanoyl-CoA dioxygenase family protein [Paenibacillus sp. LMG 31460]|uniref:Phytanoyl-CoA dioxygenase family protein n=1 Tax=Paenibacillus germinis TaxID=2654979 RepID=A0ABX1Z8Y6_9BACL|nr:phytanoyl-CoA dioxygenase family protein [Paenibacillus germinis]NOU88744.1 phytanoyl-CoA dioxygenase family protein [Paenibacillus germinis]